MGYRLFNYSIPINIWCQIKPVGVTWSKAYIRERKRIDTYKDIHKDMVASTSLIPHGGIYESDGGGVFWTEFFYITFLHTQKIYKIFLYKFIFLYIFYMIFYTNI